MNPVGDSVVDSAAALVQVVIEAMEAEVAPALVADQAAGRLAALVDRAVVRADLGDPAVVDPVGRAAVDRAASVDEAAPIPDAARSTGREDPDPHAVRAVVPALATAADPD